MKKKILALVFFLNGFACTAQTQYSIAGSGVTPSIGFSGDGGPARLMVASVIQSMVVDRKSNIYFCDRQNHRIRRIDALTGIVTTVAGTGNSYATANRNGGFADGDATTVAKFNEPTNCAFDYDCKNLYISDNLNNRIRKFNLATNTVSTILGDGTAAYAGNNIAASAATTDGPQGIAVDHGGNIYFGAGDYTIRRIDANTSNVSLICGDPNIAGLGGNNILASSAQIGIACDIKFDAIGTMYFCNAGASLIFRVDPVSGNMFRVMGNADGSSGAAVPGPALSSPLNVPISLNFDRFGNLYVGSYDYRLMKISPGGVMSFIAGTGVTSSSSTPPSCGSPLSIPNGGPGGIVADYYGNIYFTDQQTHRIYVISDGAKIIDVDINTLCKTGYSSPAVDPTFTVTAAGGAPPYTYKWISVPGNNATLNSISSRTPRISGFSGGNVAKYALSITDDGTTGCATSASRPVEVTFNTDQTYDLAMRDSWYDMYNESNNQAAVTGEWHIWDSPDVWNRIYNDGYSNHQNICSGSSCSDFVYANVRNVGCTASPSSNVDLKLYWTLGGAPETWPGDWTTNNYATSPVILPQGRQITTFTVNSMNPGSQRQYSANWVPPVPASYHSGAKEMEVCFLARIVDGHNSSNTDGMTIQEGPGLSNNVTNNNNIVTRNTSVIAVSSYSPRPSFLRVGNYDGTARDFTFQLINSNITRSTLNDFLTVTLKLDPVLFDKWLSHGAAGSYTSVDYPSHSIVFDGKNTVQLDGIPLDPYETSEVELDFTMNTNDAGDPVDGTRMQNEIIHFRQLEYQPGDEHEYSIIGNYTYQIIYHGLEDDSIVHTYGLRTATNSKPVILAKNGDVYVYPNPVRTHVMFKLSEQQSATITITDMTGRVIAKQTIIDKSVADFDVKGLANGLYLYRVESDIIKKTGKILISN